MKSKCFSCIHKSAYDSKLKEFMCSVTDCDKFSRYEPKQQPKPTNADRIRAMSDEELADTFDLLTRTKPESRDDKKTWLDWLKQEVKT